MIKDVRIVFVALVLMSFFLFSFIGKDISTDEFTIGDSAPRFKICSDKELVDLKNFKGKYVVLSFWASYDATSRMQNAALCHVANKNNDVEIISVSFDEYKSIFDESIKKDQISIKNCFVEIEGKNSELYRTYRLNRGFKNYLLDKNGVIIAENFNAKSLHIYLN